MFKDLAFALYVAEQEGWLDTPLSKEKKMDKIIKEKLMKGEDIFNKDFTAFLSIEVNIPIDAVESYIEDNYK